MMLSPSVSKIYALKKEKYISISLTSVTIEPKESIKPVLTPTPIPATKKSVQKVKNVDIGELFSDVWTKKIKKTKKKKVDNKRLQEIAKRIKPKETLPSEALTTKTESITSQEPTEKLSSSTATEVNEYLAKIQALVYERFNPPKNSQGNVVVAYIQLSSMGKMLDFRIISYSANSELNAECDKLKERLQQVIFPVNPDNQIYSGKIRIISKE